MNFAARWFTFRMVTLAALLTSSMAADRMVAADTSKPVPCVAPEYRQLDFWIGDWDVYEVGGTDKVAHVRVTRELDGCTLHEQYEDPTGVKGQSFSIYDASRNIWHQTWVTNRGQLLIIEGKLQNGEVVLSGTDIRDGLPRLVRGTWKPVAGGVRETAVTSMDGGKTWKPWFDLMFRPANTAGSAGLEKSDMQVLAALDAEYQAAVKSNDVSAMERILADDFVLVTGSGKTYNKADLLAEARQGRRVYERQDDTNQTVRIWGDTAVVTAKLWEKGTNDGKSFDYTLWFSDTYVHTPAGWRYAFGQASLPLPKISDNE